jgi:hypothetical protein
MLLNPGEVVVLQTTVEQEHDGRTGFLTLTNRRLVFEAAHSQGLLSGTTTVVAFEVAVSAIRDVQTSRKAIGRPVLQVQSFRGLARFKTVEADRWVMTILHVRATLPPPPPMHPPGMGYGAPVVVNVNQAPPPAPTVFLHCRMCGTLNPAGGGGRCSSCGAAL